MKQILVSLKFAYRETIKETVDVEGKFVRQSGGKGQYGHVWLKLEPLGLDDEYEFVDKIVGGVIPKNTYQQSIKVFKNKCKMVLLLAIHY